MRLFILGTDWWTDCDDAVAVRLLCRAAKKGEIALGAIGLNACTEGSVESLDGFVQEEGLGGVPIGVDLAATDFHGTPVYQKAIRKYAKRFSANEQAEDAVRLYRRVLAEAQEKVEIIEIGFMQVLVGVLESGADEFSPRNGMELVREKVKKVWIMAGKWDGEGESEHNFNNNARARVAAEKLCRLCPAQITFLGWEIGHDVITGKELKDGDVLKELMCVHGSPKGRMSWDPMTALMAIIGDEEEAGYDVVRGFARVDALTGANYFTRDENGPHSFVVKKWENERYERMIEERIASENG